MTPAEGQALFEGVVQLVLTCYALGLAGGLIIRLMKRAG